jgi:saccharopine dehydrogenase (NAD+, L-lysine-forming)
MKVLLVGTGGVGEAIANIVKHRGSRGQWLERLVLCDHNLERAREVSERIGDPKRFPAERVDAGRSSDVVALARKHGVDLILNACSPDLNMSIFEAALQAGTHYLDMAMSLSERHPEEPFRKTHVKLGDLQYARAKEWEKAGRLALCGSGVEPGLADVFARYAADHLFDEVHELGVRDGANLVVEGYEVAFGFSIWTTIEECLNPPVVWERERGWFTTEPFSEAEMFDFPEGIGPLSVVNVEHEEVLQMPRYLAERGLRRVTFKYALGEDFIRTLKILQCLGLDRTEKIRVGAVEVSPRDVVAAAAPNPARLGERMTGKTAAGVWVKGLKDGLTRSVYLYQVADNRECMAGVGSQAVVAQTAFNPVIMLELLACGEWQAVGVQNPEGFPAEPFIRRMKDYGFPPGMVEMDSQYRSGRDRRAMEVGLV